MIRQRIHLRGVGPADIALRLLVSAWAAALIFYGAMVVLAAAKVDPGTLNRISAYRTIDQHLNSITAAQISGADRIIVAAAGVLCAVCFGALAWRLLPRPYLARGHVDAGDTPGDGHTQVAARVLEKAALHAADGAPDVQATHARYGDGVIDLTVELADAATLQSQLTDVQARVRGALTTLGAAQDTQIDVTFAGVSASHSPKEKP